MCSSNISKSHAIIIRVPNKWEFIIDGGLEIFPKPNKHGFLINGGGGVRNISKI